MDIPAAVSGQRHLVTALDLLTLRELGGNHGQGLSVSPDGSYIAFELHQADPTANTYDVAWFVAGLAVDARPVKVGDGGDPTLFRSTAPNGRINGSWATQYAQWSPNSLGIAYRKRVEGETQIWWSSRDGRENRQLTHSPADVEEFQWARDGSAIFFTTGPDRADLKRVDRARYRAGHVFDYNEDWSTMLARPFYPPSAERVWVLDFTQGTERQLTGSEGIEYEQQIDEQTVSPVPAGARHITRTVDGSSMAWLLPANKEKQGRSPPMTLFASFSSDGSEPIRCSARECTGRFDLTRPLGTGLYWDRVHDEVLFVRKVGLGYSKRTLYGWQVKDNHVREILTTDAWLSDCSIVQGNAVCFRETPDHPRTIVSIDLTDGSRRTLVDPNPEFSNLILGDVELIEWENLHGIVTFGYLVKPVNYVPDRQYPLVIVGYRARTALRGGVGNEYPVHLLAANGFAVLVYERPTNYAAEDVLSGPLAWSKANWSPDLFDYRMPLASFESLIKVLSARGLVDPSRVGITGLSNGVGHANYALIHSELFAAAITSSSDFGPSNYFLVGSSDAHFRMHRKVIGIGRHDGPHGFLWKHISLSLNSKQVDTPLLVNVADSEHHRALEEVITLLESNQPVEMVVYPDEQHIKWQPAHRLSVYRRNVDWFNFWLRDYRDPAAEKRRQYERWQQLRKAIHSRGS